MTPLEARSFGIAGAGDSIAYEHLERGLALEEAAYAGVVTRYGLPVRDNGRWRSNVSRHRQQASFLRGLEARGISAGDGPPRGASP